MGCCIANPAEHDLSKLNRPTNARLNEMEQLMSNARFVKTYLEGRWTPDL